MTVLQAIQESYAGVNMNSRVYKEMCGCFKVVSKAVCLPDEQKVQEKGKPRVLYGTPEKLCLQNIFYEIKVNKLTKDK